jgi:hypothetical protein
VPAENAVHALHVEIHYLSCGDKVARSSIKRREQSKPSRENDGSYERSPAGLSVWSGKMGDAGLEPATSAL